MSTANATVSAATGALGLPQSPASPLRFASLPDAAFGIEVNGIEWGSPDAETVRLITAALRRHLLVVFRGQRSPSEAELDHFFRGFGRLVLDTEDGLAHYAGHINRGGPASEMATESWQYLRRNEDNTGSTMYDPGEVGQSPLVWHNDQSHRPMLKVLSVFEALDVEDSVVPTEYRDHYTAYETLSPDLRAALELKQVIYFDPRLPGPDEMPRLADATHPVFTPHPHTGRRALYVNDFADRIVGLNRAQSDSILAELRRHIDAAAPRYTHRWRNGDMVVWDNIGLQHRRDAVPPHQLRTMRQYGGLAE